MRDEPTYAATLHRGVSGIDPLDHGTLTERMYDRVFPGINNVVRYIRVYSALCWVVQQVCDGRSGASLQQARERMELLLLWINPRRGLAGERRRKRFPAIGDNKPITLTFKAFGSNTATLFHAAQYKPSLTTGLRFLDYDAETEFRCSDPFGLDLARAFDASVRQDRKGHKFLTHHDKLQARLSDMTGIANALDVTAPSSGEKRAFLASFFPAKCPDDGSVDALRWNSLRLMLRSVQAVCESRRAAGESDEATLNEVRSCMARGCAPGGAPSVLSPEVADVYATWSVLQLWHLQRLCLETLSYLVELWLRAHANDGVPLTVASCAAAIAGNVVGPHTNLSPTKRVDHTVEHFRSIAKRSPTLYAAAARRRADCKTKPHDSDVWFHIQSISDVSTAVESNEGGSALTAAHCYAGLIFCAVETGNLRRLGGPVADELKRVDDVHSLLQLEQLVQRSKTESSAAFLQHVIAKWVIHRHFEVAARRTAAADNEGRFRYVDGDYGLEGTRSHPNVPRVTADRLEQALLLCEQGGLLARAKGAATYKLSPSGRARVK